MSNSSQAVLDEGSSLFARASTPTGCPLCFATTSALRFLYCGLVLRVLLFVNNNFGVIKLLVLFAVLRAISLGRNWGVFLWEADCFVSSRHLALQGHL